MRKQEAPLPQEGARPPEAALAGAPALPWGPSVALPAAFTPPAGKRVIVHSARVGGATSSAGLPLPRHEHFLNKPHLDWSIIHGAVRCQAQVSERLRADCPPGTRQFAYRAGRVGVSQAWIRVRGQLCGAGAVLGQVSACPSHAVTPSHYRKGRKQGSHVAGETQTD